MPLYKCYYFKLEELVSKEIFSKYGDRAWQFLDPRLLASIDAIRVFFNVPMTANNWHKKGPRKYSGFRERSCEVGADESQHRHGRACDLVCKIPAKDLRERIRTSPEKFPHITTIEDDVDWLHVDVRQREEKSIVLIKP